MLEVIARATEDRLKRHGPDLTSPAQTGQEQRTTRTMSSESGDTSDTVFTGTPGNGRN